MRASEIIVCRVGEADEGRSQKRPQSPRQLYCRLVITATRRSSGKQNAQEKRRGEKAQNRKDGRDPRGLCHQANERPSARALCRVSDGRCHYGRPRTSRRNRSSPSANDLSLGRNQNDSLQRVARWLTHRVRQIAVRLRGCRIARVFGNSARRLRDVFLLLASLIRQQAGAGY